MNLLHIYWNIFLTYLPLYLICRYVLISEIWRLNFYVVDSEHLLLSYFFHCFLNLETPCFFSDLMYTHISLLFVFFLLGSFFQRGFRFTTKLFLLFYGLNLYSIFFNWWNLLWSILSGNWLVFQWPKYLLHSLFPFPAALDSSSVTY